MDASGPASLTAACEGCGAAVEVADIFSFDCTCPGCGGTLVLGGEGEDAASLAFLEEASLAAEATESPHAAHDDRSTKVDTDEEELFERQEAPLSVYDRPTKADTEDDPYELAAQALDSSVSRSTSRLATSRRTTQAVTAYSEAELFGPDMPSTAPETSPPATSSGPQTRSALLPGTPPDAPPVPSWDDTGKVDATTGDAPASDLEGLVEVVEVPVGGTAGRGSRTYERGDVLGGAGGEDAAAAAATSEVDGASVSASGVSARFGKPDGGGGPGGLEALPPDDVSTREAGERSRRTHRADGPLFGEQDLDWLALIDDNLPEGDAGDADGKPRVVIRLPEDAAPTDAADSDRVRQFEQAIKNLEAGGPAAIDGLLRGGPSDTAARRARRYDGSSTQPIPGSATQPIPPTSSDEATGSTTQPLKKRAEEDTRSWDTREGTGSVRRPPSGRSEQAAPGGEPGRPRGPRTVDTFHHDDLDPALVCARDSTSPQADRFRHLVERIFHPAEGTPPRIIMVTSPRPGDGKTTVAANLAVAAAGRLPGRSAVLVDADPRGRGVLHSFGVRTRDDGLLEALRFVGVPDPRDFVLQFSLGALDVIPLGIPSSDAVELLESDRMVAFLGRLRDAYPGAAIIVDASSVLHAADPLVLARGVDGVVLVVRADRTPRDEVRRAIEVLGSKRVLGLVLNDSAT